MNRFTGKTENKNKLPSFLSIALFLSVTALVVYGANAALTSSNNQEASALKSALNRDIIHCYASEGVYPESLAYIEENYGLTYDHEKFVIDYQPVAKNIMPEVTVIDKGGS